MLHFCDRLLLIHHFSPSLEYWTRNSCLAGPPLSPCSFVGFQNLVPCSLFLLLIYTTLPLFFLFPFGFNWSEKDKEFASHKASFTRKGALTFGSAASYCRAAAIRESSFQGSGPLLSMIGPLAGGTMYFFVGGTSSPSSSFSVSSIFSGCCVALSCRLSFL